MKIESAGQKIPGEIIETKNAARAVKPESGVPPEIEEKLKDLSQHFEAIFVNQMVGEMRKTVDRSGFVKESQGEKIFRSMLDNEFAGKISQSEQLGLSKIIYDQLLRSALGR